MTRACVTLDRPVTTTLAAPETAPVFENETPEMVLLPERDAPEPVKEVKPVTPDMTLHTIGVAAYKLTCSIHRTRAQSDAANGAAAAG